jgi:hypothetical protein
LTHIALAQPPQEGIGIEAGIMAIAPRELECISSNRFHVLQHDDNGHIVRLQAKFTRPLIRACCARTPLPEIPDRIDGLMAITPGDAQYAFL